MDGSARGREKKRKSHVEQEVGRGGEGAGRTDRGDESERNFTPLPCCVCVFRISTLTGGRGAQIIARGMRTYCAG